MTPNQTDSLNKGTLTLTSNIFSITSRGRIPIAVGHFHLMQLTKALIKKIK